MKKGVVKFFVIILIIIFIVFIGKMLIDSNVLKVGNYDFFEADNENYFKIIEQTIVDGGGVKHYNVDLLNKKIVHYINNGMINNDIKVIYEKSLNEEEVIILKDLFINASEDYIEQYNNVKYYEISNGKKIYMDEEKKQLEQILRNR